MIHVGMTAFGGQGLRQAGTPGEILISPPAGVMSIIGEIMSSSVQPLPTCCT